MIAVKNQNELACCKGYPCYADAFDRLDNCPFNPPTTEHKYAYGTQYPFNNIDVVINCKKISFAIGEVAIELDNEAIDKINVIEINGKKFVKREEKR